MKKALLILVLIVGSIGIQSCEGPRGERGEPGYNIEAEVFEVTRSFGPSNNYSSLVPLDPAILNSDVVLVYMLWDTDNGTPIWRLVPQTVQLEEGDLQYNYDFTRFDVNLFLSSMDFNLNILGSQWTQNQRFRIVLLPGYFSGSRHNTEIYNDYEATIEAFGLKDKSITILP